MIFILGGNGFVGSAFSRFCQRNNLEHVVITRENYDEFKGMKSDILVNANGNSSKLLSKKDPLKDFLQTVESVRKSLLDFEFSKYILLSSCDVYPDCSSPDNTYEKIELNVSKQSIYGFHKYLSEQCIIHSESNWLIVRLGSMVGNKLRKNAIYDILHGGPLWLNPQSQLQFLNTDDVAQIVFDLIKQVSKNDVINVCGNGLVKLQNILDKTGSVEVKPESPIVKYNVNIEKLNKLVTVPDSMKTVINFIKNS